MLHKTNQWRLNGVKTAMLFAFAVLLFTIPLTGQDLCEAVNCGNLSIEIVKQDANVSSSCPTSSAPCTDKFRQISYKVYLRSQKYFNNPNDTFHPFNLDYKLLDIKVNLNNNSTPQYSHIDVAATQNCFTNGNGAYWYNYSNSEGDKVIFSPLDNSVSISFSNMASGSPNCGSTGQNNTGNIIRFELPQATNADFCGPSANFKCLYVELFTIVVNAYPGELVGFNLDNTNKYEPKSSATVCTPINPVTSGNFNGLSNTTVSNPDGFASTANATIEAQLLTPVGTADGGYEFPVALKNTGTTNRVVSYAEFVLKATLSNLTEPLTYTINTPREHFGGTNPQTGQTTRYIHYILTSAVMLTPGQTVEVGRIKAGPATLINQSWVGSINFEGATTQPRVKTGEACTLLKTSGGPQTVSANGDAPCSDPSIRFKITGISGGCGDLKVKAELYSTNAPAAIQLTKVDFSVTFDFDSPGISITGVNYTDWPSFVCSQSGCFTPGLCYTISPDGKTFNYCFSVPDNAPTTFQLDPSASMEIVFSNTETGCITHATMTELAIKYVNTSAVCIPRLDEPEGFSICANSIKGLVETEDFLGVEEVEINLEQASSATCSSLSCSDPCPINSTFTDVNGAYSFCDVCTTCNRFLVRPEKTDNPLNGVTTYDLVLISQHILGSMPLNTPYKMIAADANNSGGITTFDIVEFRKLILGIYQTNLPANTSWRFVDKSYTFPNQNNPFQSGFPETVNCIAPQSSTVNFVGIKVGDVNNSGTPNARPGERPVTSLSWPTALGQPGSVVTIPVAYTGSEAVEALQFGLRFDPAVLQLISPSTGDLETYTADNFNLLRAAEGEIRTLWLPLGATDERIRPGTVLFHLTFKVLSHLPENRSPLRFDDELLECLAWKMDGEEFRLQHNALNATKSREQAKETSIQASLSPNPTSGAATLTVVAETPEKARVMLFDAFGRRLGMQQLVLAPGSQEIPLPEVQNQPPGVYLWKIFTPTQKAGGHLIKQ